MQGREDVHAVGRALILDVLMLLRVNQNHQIGIGGVGIDLIVDPIIAQVGLQHKRRRLSEDGRAGQGGSNQGGVGLASFPLSQALAWGLGGQTMTGQPTIVNIMMTRIKLRSRQY